MQRHETKAKRSKNDERCVVFPHEKQCHDLANYSNSKS